MVTTVFDFINNSPQNIEFKIKVSIVEIYCEKIRDLLDNSKINLKIREDKTRGVYIQDVTEVYVSEDVEVYNLMKSGNSNRSISATNMNEGSSRSHSLFLLTISQNNIADLSVFFIFYIFEIFIKILKGKDGKIISYRFSRKWENI